MPRLRPYVGALIALVLAAVTASAAAQNVKKFDLGAPASASTTTMTVQVTFKNLENGNSSFNSIGIKGTTAGGVGLTINGGTASPGGPGTPSTSGGYFFLTGLAPVKKGDTLTVTLNVTISGSTCASGNITWHGRAFTGSPSSPSTEFAQNNADPVTTIAASCTYSISGSTPTSIVKGTSQSLAVTVSNAASSTATITSVSLTPPAGITTTGSTYAVSIAPGSSAVINVAATGSCGAGVGGSWTSAIAGFTRSGGEPSTTVAGNCSLSISAPTSAVAGTAFDVSITAKNGNGATLAGFTGNVTLVAGCPMTGTNPVAAVGGVAGFNVALNPAADVGTCSLKATATIDGSPFETSPVLAMKVFDGVLACNNAVPALDALSLPMPAGTAGAFPDTAPAPGAGYVVGMRGSGNDKTDVTCTNINYAIFNNVATPDSGSSLTDPAGNTVPPGYFSFTWDQSQALNPVVAILTTYRSEWGDAVTGLPTRQTKVCAKSPPDVCSTAADYQVVPACEASKIERASIPMGQSACLASEGWRVVPVGDAQYCAEAAPSPPASPPPGWAPRCVQMTSIVIFGKDPVFGR